MLKYLILLGEGWHINLSDVLKAVKDEKMDLKTAEQQSFGLVSLPWGGRGHSKSSLEAVGPDSRNCGVANIPADALLANEDPPLRSLCAS